MVEDERHDAAEHTAALGTNTGEDNGAGSAENAPQNLERRENRRWWIRLLLQPLLFFVAGTALLVGLGFLQRTGLISANLQHPAPADGGGTSSARYICPMMCTPSQSEPGRCPVCAMELVPASSSENNIEGNAIQIDSATRRIANIETTAVVAIPTPTREIRSIGELSYDETTRKTISAYVAGRLERLYADYTGVEVRMGDHLALIYSPALYSAQVEFLLAKKSRDHVLSAQFDRVKASNEDLYHSAKQRLVELGMVPDQIAALERTGEANSRLQLFAPIHGTVTEKLAVEGSYVSEGQPIYRLADLSTLWLMLRVFPEDAAAIRYGQKVEAIAQSLPQQTISGRVAFVEPHVDPKTRTVGVRVVIKNENNRLRVGDLVRATLYVPVASQANELTYDPELSSKWISPRHPHIISSEPGSCPSCGIALVPSKSFGYADAPQTSSTTLVIPRQSLLSVGERSVVYVETAPGRFELRRVSVGPEIADKIIVYRGLDEGDFVATRGNFLIDSQMQLAGNPSLIDPDKASRQHRDAPTPDYLAWIAKLPSDEIGLAETQRFCPVSDALLGTMGVPIRVDVGDHPVFICCEKCRERLLVEPDVYLAKLEQRSAQTNTDSQVGINDLPPITDPEEYFEEMDDDSSSDSPESGISPDSTEIMP